MKNPQLRWQSPSTGALIGRLLSSQTFVQRLWYRPDQTLAILDEIAATHEPLAIPSLLSIGCTRNAKLRAKARSVIRQLFAHLPIEALPLLDSSLRRYSMDLEDWNGIKPQEIESMAGRSDDDRLYVALLSCHRSGYVRAEALRVLGADVSDTTLAFVLLRLVDWVPEVRARAETEFRKRLNTSSGDALIRCLALMDRLAACAQFRPDHARSVDEILRSAEHADSLRRAFSSPSRMVRRHCYRIAIANPAFSPSDVIQQALLDHDVIVRKWAFTEGRLLPPPSESELMGRAAHDSYSPIRRIAFDAFVPKASSSIEEVSPFLYDRATSIRLACQSLLERIGHPPAAFYRDALRAPVSRTTHICILGLAETGDRSDTALIAPMLAGRSARVRRAAIRALRTLRADGQQAILRRLVSSDVPSVAREAASSLLAAREVPASGVWADALANPNKRVPVSVLGLMWRAGKWEQLRLYLQAVALTQPKLVESGIGMLALWLKRFNRTFVQPAPSDTASLRSLMNSARSQMPQSLSSDLDFILKTVRM